MKTRNVFMMVLSSSFVSFAVVWALFRPAVSSVQPVDAALVKHMRPLTISSTGRVGSTDQTAFQSKIDWRSIESKDYRTYIANLREIHCPEETIRYIIIAVVNKLYATRLETLQT